MPLWFGPYQIIIRLQDKPEFRAGTESFGKQPGAFRRDSTLATHDFIPKQEPGLFHDALNRYTDVPIGLANRKGYLRQPERVQKFFKQDFAGMGGDTVFREHGTSLVVI